MSGFQQTDIDFDVLGLMAGRVRIRARGRVEIVRRIAGHGGFGSPAGARPIPTVRDLVAPAPLRLAHALASAAIVRDAAAFGALVLFGTMLAVLCNVEPMV